MARFEVLILGSSSALPAYGRHPTAQLVNIHENFFLVDCGEGTQNRLVEYGCKAHRIQAIFISHLHGDHYFGLPGLLTSMNLLGRTDPLTVFSPEGLDHLIEEIIRLGQGQLQYEIHWHPLSKKGKQKIFENRTFEVFSFPLAHRIPTFGFMFCEKPGMRKIKPEMLAGQPIPYDTIQKLKSGTDVPDESGRVFLSREYTEDPPLPRKYAYCSDTLPLPGLASIIQGVDLLYHESTYMEEHLEKAGLNHHSTASQAAGLAVSGRVKKLIIGHFSSRYKLLDGLLDEAKAVFPNTELALEGKKFEVGREGL